MIGRYSIVAILLSVFVLSTKTGFAKVAPNEKVLVLNDNMSGEFIGDYFYIVKDTNYKWNINTVTDPAFDKNFVRSDLKRSNFGNEELAIWNKLTVTNQSDHEWLFDIGVWTLDSISVYYPNADGSYRVVNDGRAFPFADKKYKSDSYLFDLNIPKGDTLTIYFRVCSFIMQYPTQVYVKEGYINEAHNRDLTLGLYIGLIILVIFYNFFIWWSTKDVDYLYYTVYAVFTALFVGEIDGLGHEFIFNGIFSFFRLHGPLFVAMSSISSIAFSVKFLETKRRARRLDKVLRYIFIPALIVVIIIDLLGDKLLASLLNQGIGFIAIFILIAAAIYSYRSGLLAARYFLLAKISYFIGIMLFILKTAAVLPYNTFYNHAIETGLCLEMILFSFALAGKLNQYEKDKNRAIEKNQKLIREQNTKLELMVGERTQELQAEKLRSDELLIDVTEQKKETEKQKFIIEAKHKEIRASINYAERIQRSLLATHKILSENLHEYFVLFEPKDIVSGDFYWANKLSNNNFALVTADSTGHGVPGAIMSILNISCLEKAIEAEKLTQPADILNHTRRKIIETLQKGGVVHGGKDGMDVSLVCFDFANRKMIYASANNPIWIIRNKTIIELSVNKMPVGKHDKDHESFTQHEVSIEKGDMIYTFTDGIPDQFGGPKGKKFMYKKLKELLLSIADESLDHQKKIIANVVKQWKGDLVQTDDITVVGVRIQ
ncbi:MAG: SpoIIE family protein phosphatase [Bacteroidetes bacterium]|nr:SpoIIE family protein phosphatase [Bacteroidota bacterium]